MAQSDAAARRSVGTCRIYLQPPLRSPLSSLAVLALHSAQRTPDLLGYGVPDSKGLSPERRMLGYQWRVIPARCPDQTNRIRVATQPVLPSLIVRHSASRGGCNR